VNIRPVTILPLVFLLNTLAVCGTTFAQAERSPYDEDVLREARRVYDQIMSPYCPGQTLSNCGSSQADILRAQIRQRIAAGESAESIVQSLVDEFGDDVRAEPPKSGFASLVWLGPIVLLFAGAVVIVFYVRRNTVRPQDDKPGRGDPHVRSRVEEELKTTRD
jgi:cytochrome c-type biogenesis protein CcmH